jgi:hypothetical protein
VIIARFPARRRANPEWHDTSLAIPPQLASATFRNIFTGKRLCARDVEVALDLVFDVLPVAVFEMESQN